MYLGRARVPPPWKGGVWPEAGFPQCSALWAQWLVQGERGSQSGQLQLLRRFVVFSCSSQRNRHHSTWREQPWNSPCLGYAKSRAKSNRKKNMSWWNHLNLVKLTLKLGLFLNFLVRWSNTFYFGSNQFGLDFLFICNQKKSHNYNLVIKMFCSFPPRQQKILK